MHVFCFHMHNKCNCVALNFFGNPNRSNYLPSNAYGINLAILLMESKRVRELIYEWFHLHSIWIV